MYPMWAWISFRIGEKMTENNVEEESEANQEKVVDMLLSSASERTLDSESMI